MTDIERTAKGAVLSKLECARRLNMNPHTIAAWVVSEQIPLYPIITGGKTVGIDERGFAKIAKLAEAFRQAVSA